MDWIGSASLSDAPDAVAMRLREQLNFSTASKAQSYVESRKEVFTFLENQGVLVSVAGYFDSTVGLVTLKSSVAFLFLMSTLRLFL